MRKDSKTSEPYPAETIGIDGGDKMSRYLILDRDTGDNRRWLLSRGCF